MKIVGCDLHTRYQQIAMLDQETGELIERRLEHESGEARAFYAALSSPVRVGIEATGHTRWFERMLAELGHELWIGDAAQIRASVVRKQKTHARDAAHLLELLLSERFPRIWRPTMAERDLRQLVWPRQKLVWMRNGGRQSTARFGDGRGSVPKEEAVHEERARRVGESGAGSLGELSPAGVADDARSVRRFTRRTGSRGGGASGTECRRCPSHDASGSRAGDFAGVRANAGTGGAVRAEQTGGELSGTEPARALFGRTAAVRCDLETRQSDDALVVGRGRTHSGAVDGELRQDYQRLKLRRGSGVAKVAIARKLAVRMYWMLRGQASYAQLVRMQGSPWATLVTE